MKRLSVALLGVLSFALAWAAEPPTQDASSSQDALAAPSSAPAHAPLRARLTDDAIVQAVRDTLAEEPSTPLADGQVLSGGPYREFADAVTEARRGYCMRPNALKQQPARIGPIQLGGILAIPHWLGAMARGKCNW